MPLPCEHLYLKLNKCHFFVESAKILGCIVSRTEIEIRQLQALLLFQLLTPHRYAPHLYNAASVATPLHKLAGNCSDFRWTDEHDLALTAIPLVTTDLSPTTAPLHLVLDASRLTQALPGWVKETSSPLTVYTDSLYLSRFLQLQHPTQCQARWLEQFAQFDFKAQHIPGIKNKIADALSRLPTTLSVRPDSPPSSLDKPDLPIDDAPQDPSSMPASVNIVTRPPFPSKLRPCFIGPYKIIRVLPKDVCKLHFPPQFRLHPVINGSKLWPFYPNDNCLFPRRSFMDDAPAPVHDDHFKIDTILKHRWIKDQWQFLLKFVGLPLSEARWTAEADMDTPDFIAAYERLKPGSKLSSSSALPPI
ncbi:hypothetical protein JCM5296_002184 [Sporobolomyces johnsonii]